MLEGVADGTMGVVNECRVTTLFTELHVCFFCSPRLGRAVFNGHLL